MMRGFFLATSLLLLSACGDDATSEPEPTGGSGSKNSGGKGGSAGKAGSAGKGGSVGGGSGAGQGGSAGAEAGQGGSGGAGQGGAGGAGAGQSGAGGAGAGGAGAGGAGGAGAGGAGAGGAGSGGAGQGGEAGGGAGGGQGGAAGEAGQGGACVASSLGAKLEKVPVDVIVYIDGSGTMAPALDAVNKTIDQNFAQKMGASALDYRVIMLTTSQIPANPSEPARWFYYKNLGGSGALHENLLNWYNASAAGNQPPGGYSDWVRDESFKVFLIISDTSGGPSMDGLEFDQKLLALQPARFGTAAQRNYRYHAIIGLKENDPVSSPWPPTAPVVTDECTGYNGALAPGENAQEVAILTGGLRFPLCQFDQYDIVFSTIADGIAKSTAVACDFAVPSTPDGKPIDPNTILLEYTPGEGGAKQKFSQAKDEGACAPDRFYIDQETVKLCPQACQVVQADLGAKIDVTYGCDVGFKP